MASSLWSSISELWRWNWEETLGISMVFIGVLGTVVVAVFRVRKFKYDESDLMPSEFWKRRWETKRSILEGKKKRWEFGFECILVVGLALEIIGFSRQFSQDVALNRRIEELRAKNNILWQHSRPRFDILMNSPESRNPKTGDNILVSELKQMPKGTADILYIEDDKEADTFATIGLAWSLIEAGWKVDKVAEIPLKLEEQLAPYPGGGGVFLISQNFEFEEVKTNINPFEVTNAMQLYKTDTPYRALVVALKDAGFSGIGESGGMAPSIAKVGVIQIVVGREVW
jgi:hypothetical protein